MDLVDACFQGGSEGLRAFLSSQNKKKRSGVVTQDDVDHALLYYIYESDVPELDIVEILVLEAKANLLLPPSEEDGEEGKTTALHLAVRNKNPEVVAFLSEQGGPELLKALDEHGRPAHMVACEFGELEMLEYLVANYPNVIGVNERFGHKQEALLHANVARFNPEVAKFLLRQPGINVNITNARGETPLHLPIRRCVVQQLLDMGADITLRDEDGNTPILAACSIENATEPVKCLLQAGARVFEERNFAGQTSLHKAALCHSGYEVFQLLLEQPQEPTNIGERVELVNVADKEGNTALHYACRSGGNAVSSKVCKLLLGQPGINVNAQNCEGQTPLTVLMNGPNSNNSSAIEMLLEHGADCNIPDKHGNTVLMAAVIKTMRVSKMARVLRDVLLLGPNDGKNKKQNSKMKKETWKTANVNHVNKHGFSALTFAAILGNITVVQLLLDRGALVDDDGGGPGWMALQEVATHSHCLPSFKEVGDRIRQWETAKVPSRYGIIGHSQWPKDRDDLAILFLLIQARVAQTSHLVMNRNL